MPLNHYTTLCENNDDGVSLIVWNLKSFYLIDIPTTLQSLRPSLPVFPIADHHHSDDDSINLKPKLHCIHISNHIIDPAHHTNAVEYLQ